MSTKREREVDVDSDEKKLKLDKESNDEEFPRFDLIIVTAPKKIEEEEEDIGEDDDEDEDEDEYDEEEDEDEGEDEDEDEEQDEDENEEQKEQNHDKKSHEDDSDSDGNENGDENKQDCTNEKKQKEDNAEKDDELLGSFVKDQQLQRWSRTPLLSYIQTVKKMSLSLYDHTEEGWKEIDMIMDGIKLMPEPTTEKREVIGMCIVREDKHSAEITQLYVDGEYRYHGVGGRIVRSVLRLQRERGATQCITFAVGSSHFYKKVGFRKRKCKDNAGSERCEMFINL